MKWLPWTRKQNREQKSKTNTRSFTAAQHSNLTHSWVKQPVSLDQELWGSLNTLRARAREQAHNNPYVIKFLNLCKANIIGSRGIQLQNRATLPSGELDQVTNDAIEKAFLAWGQNGNCEVTGRLSWLDVQRLLIETIARDGEVLIRIVQGYDNAFGFAIQLIDVDYLDTDLNGTLPSGNTVRLGVEVDIWQRTVAYHLKRPQAWSLYAQVGPEQERIPAQEIIHVYNPTRAHQVRGIPWLHAVLLQLQMMGGYVEAELVAARLAASKMGFFERNSSGEGYSGDGVDDESIISHAEPGTLEQLPQGVSFKAWDINHPAGNFDPFIKACLRGIASGLGVSYNSLANDLTSVNYSSIRAGVLEEREHWQVLQTWFSEQCCTPIFNAWLKAALLTQQLPYKASEYNKLAKAHWQGRRWPWVDPLKDLKAIELELQLGLTSLDEVIRRLGRDPRQVFQNLVKTREELKKLGLTELLNRFYPSDTEQNNDDEKSETTITDKTTVP